MTEPSYSDAELRRILNATKSIAMVGVSANTIRPSWFVGNYLSAKGFRIVPINPGIEGQTLFGATVRSGLDTIPGDEDPIHMVDIFRRSEHVLPIVEDAIRHLGGRGLKCIWMQIGVINEEAAKLAEDAGIDVVMNRCPKMEYQRLVGELSWGGVNSGIISSKLR